jgi:hypothetical protein
MSSRIIGLVFVGLFTLFASIWLGMGVATSQASTLLIMVATIGFLSCLLLGQKIWILMIMFMGMEVPLIQGFMVPELGQGLFIGFSIMMFFMRKLKTYWKFTEMDFCRFLLVLCIGQVYIRNPVGLNMFGAGAVGARPYFITALAFIASFILSKYRVDAKEIKWAMWASILGSFLTLPLNVFRYGLAAGPAVGSVSTSVGYQGEGAGRAGKYNTWAYAITTFIGSRINPVRACIHPLWAIGILLSLALAAMSGYRNTVANVGLLYLIAIAYRGGFLSVAASVTTGSLALVLLALLNSASPLPPNVQRALSPFPGTWDKRYSEQAQESTEWRTVMWEEALLTDDWIQNKILGDGLGMTRMEYEKLLDAESGMIGRSFGRLTVQQESMMITGSYHSGPVQTIRTIGYVGLFLMLFIMVRMMVHTHRLIVRSRDTEWFVTILFFGLPIMVFPLFWTFVVGDFRGGAIFIFIYSALLDVLENNLPLPARPRVQRGVYVPMIARKQLPA